MEVLRCPYRRRCFVGNEEPTTESEEQVYNRQCLTRKHFKCSLYVKTTEDILAGSNENEKRLSARVDLLLYRLIFNDKW